MCKKGVLITKVDFEGLAFRHGIKVGDTILKINNESVIDQLRYQFLITQKDVTNILLLRRNGQKYLAVIDNGGNGIGIDLAKDSIKTCRQNCIFCFVQQMPSGLRKTLYLKDEDIRLSFLYGNYTTLSSSDDDELDRIVKDRLTPINVSIHATDPTIRAVIVGNVHEGDILKKIDRLLLGNINIHAQIVLVPGVNDGDVLEHTIDTLWQRRAFQASGILANRGGVLSLSCVPVGLTIHRKGILNIKFVDASYASKIVKKYMPLVRQYTKLNNGDPWFLLSDEWFVRASLTFPRRALYSKQWLHLENGIGMIRKFMEHSKQFINKGRGKLFYNKSLLLLTGVDFAPILNSVVNRLNSIFGCKLRVLAVKNDVFGDSITVSGLLCGSTLASVAYLDKKKCLHRENKWVDAVVIPSASLCWSQHIYKNNKLCSNDTLFTDAYFLDNMKVGDLERYLGVPIIPSGDNLMQLMRNIRNI